MKKKKSFFLRIAVLLTAIITALVLTGCPGESPINSASGGPLEDPPPPIEGLLILQAYGSSSNAAGISHPFVELYNTTNAAISLNGVGLYYADGTDAGNGGTATEDGAWKRLSLDGKTIPAGGSFLILGPKQSPTAARYQIPDDSGDINDPNFILSNRAFKVALLQSTAALTVQNPFNTDGNGTKAAGYIDMVGAANEYQTRDFIFGFEAVPARNSASEAVRRLSLTDTNVNRGASTTFPTATGDFTSVRYATGTNSISDEELALRKPRNSSAGKWAPFATIQPPTPSTPSDGLMIWQIGAATDGNVSHSFVELYNNGTTAVNLSGYSLQYAEGTRNNPSATQDGAWTKIDLSGTIPPKQSFLILGSKGTMASPALNITANSGDMNQSFVISNRSFKVVLLSNTTLLTAAVQNPFDTGSGVKVAGYVDMVGAINTANEDRIFGFETSAITDLNKQTGQRRTSLVDTDNNKSNFARATYLGASATNLEIWRPKNLAYGAWNPITGVKQ